MPSGLGGGYPSPQAPSSQRAPPAAPSAQQAQGAPIQLPQVRGFRILAQRTASASELIGDLSALSFLKIVQDANDPETIMALNVEGRDIQKNPFIFSICYFRRDSIDVLYTMSAGSSPKKRKLDVLKHALNMLTLASSSYRLDTKYIFQIMEGAISDMNEFVSSDYDKLFSTYDSLKSETELLKKRVKELTDAHSVLSKENYDLKVKNGELTLKLKGLEAYSDQVLGLKIQEWLGEHNGEINISEFCRVNNVGEARVEQLLNKMVSEGYLETSR